MPQEQSYREIHLTKGQVARVSPQDYEWLNSLKWSALWNKFTKSYYAVHLVWISAEQTTRTFYMQRMILRLKHGDKRQADHKDRNTLNNTRENLRIATQQQNAFNMKLRRDNSTGYKGVYKEGRKEHGPGFHAYLFCKGIRTYVGKFPTAEEANAARCERAKQLHGAFFRAS